MSVTIIKIYSVKDWVWSDDGRTVIKVAPYVHTETRQRFDNLTGRLTESQTFEFKPGEHPIKIKEVGNER